MDSIVLRGMQFFGRHGVLPEETMGQRFVVHARLFLDLHPAGRSDDLQLSVDYGNVYEVVRRVVEGRPRYLIEAVAETIAQEVLGTFPVIQSVEIEVEKPGAPIPGVFASVGVRIERHK